MDIVGHHVAHQVYLLGIHPAVVAVAVGIAVELERFLQRAVKGLQVGHGGQLQGGGDGTAQLRIVAHKAGYLVQQAGHAEGAGAEVRLLLAHAAQHLLPLLVKLLHTVQAGFLHLRQRAELQARGDAVIPVLEVRLLDHIVVDGQDEDAPLQVENILQQLQDFHGHGRVDAVQVVDVEREALLRRIVRQGILDEAGNLLLELRDVRLAGVRAEEVVHHNRNLSLRNGRECRRGAEAYSRSGCGLPPRHCRTRTESLLISTCRSTVLRYTKYSTSTHELQ